MVDSLRHQSSDLRERVLRRLWACEAPGASRADSFGCALTLELEKAIDVYILPAFGITCFSPLGMSGDQGSKSGASESRSLRVFTPWLKRCHVLASHGAVRTLGDTPRLRVHLIGRSDECLLSVISPHAFGQPFLPGPEIESDGVMTDTTGEPTVFVVIPAYNEATTVRDVVQQVKAHYENVVVVDDGSTDATGAEAIAGGGVVVSHVLNRGQGAALQTGIDYALLQGADIIVTFDSDGQHQVDDIERLLIPVVGGKADVALGSRFLESQSQIPFIRKLTLKMGVLFTRVVSGIHVTDAHNGLRALSRSAALRIQIRQDRMAHASEILDEISRLRLRYCEVATKIVYSEYARQKGQRSSAAFRIVYEFLLGKWE
ncbi:MAG: glycosyltransferase family 2 protein [Verrucomicrobiia bacterium]